MTAPRSSWVAFYRWLVVGLQHEGDCDCENVVE